MAERASYGWQAFTEMPINKGISVNQRIFTLFLHFLALKAKHGEQHEVFVSTLIHKEAIDLKQNVLNDFLYTLFLHFLYT